jgi:hypothetical protein
MENLIQQKLENTQITLSWISFICSLLIIIFFIKYTNLRSLTYYFILLISISEIIGNFPYCLKIWNSDKKIINNIINNINIFIAFSDSYTMFSLLSYSYLISLFLKNNDQNIFKTKNNYLILSFIISIIYLIIVKLSQKPNNDIRILINQSNENKKLHIFHLIINLIISILILFIIRMTVKNIKNQAKTDQKNKWKILSVCHTLYNYPLIGSIGWFFSFFTFILQLINSENKDLKRLKCAIYVFGTIIFHLRGTLIFYEFITSEKVVKNMEVTLNIIKYKLTSGKRRKMSLE